MIKNKFNDQLEFSKRPERALLRLRKELRLFAKKRMIEFSVRDITKTNLTKRDYKFLSNRTGDNTMAESKLYGTSRISYQDVGSARLVIKHTESVNQEQATGRTRNVGTIYIESSEGERFKYPYKHLNGARAMARHVAEGGNAYDDFGKHIVSLSEEQAKLSKFKRYMGRSAVMAESLAEYNDAVNERIVAVKKTLQNLQKKDYYTETFESFTPAVMEDVPNDVAENWIDQLTIKQFNEELKDIFPYVFKLVSEVTKAKELGPDDVVAEDGCTPAHRKANKKKKAKEDIEIEQGFERMMGQFSEDDLDRESVTWDELKPYVTLVYKEIIADIKQAREEIKNLKSAGDDGDEGGDIAMIMPRVKDLVDMAEYPKEILNNPDFDIETIVSHMMPASLDTSPREELVGRFKTAIGSKDPQLAKRLFIDPDLEDDTMAVKIDKDGAISKDDGEAEKEQKIPLGEFILSYFDRETGEFPKGETAVLTMIEKDYGEQFIEPAKAFIEQIQAKFEEYQMQAHPQQMEVDPEYDRMRELAGLR